jgi:hypothetical protein
MKAVLTAIILLGFFVQTNAQKQGICGKILWVEGDQMPGPGTNKKSSIGVPREILIYEPVTLQQVTEAKGLYQQVKAKLINKGQSSTSGLYKIKLPSGKYSVFVKEPDGLFANIFDGQGYINTVEIKRGKFTEFTVTINYKAAY